MAASFLMYPAAILNSHSPPLLSFTRSLNPFPTSQKFVQLHKRIFTLSIKARALDFSTTFFEGESVEDDGDVEEDDDYDDEDDDVDDDDFDYDDEPPIVVPDLTFATALEDKEEPPCPPGLRRYETMAVLRPDMSEDERLNLTQKYEEMLVAGGGMYVEVFNQGVIPLAYSIRKKNKAGETNTYLDGIYLLFTYFTKPEGMKVLESSLVADDDVIRSTSFKVRKRKY